MNDMITNIGYIMDKDLVNKTLYLLGCAQGSKFSVKPSSTGDHSINLVIIH